jgi:YbbR domain-containing protein
MRITLTAGISRTFENVPINYRFNNAGYRFTLLDPEDAYTSVEIFGAVERVNALTPDDIQVYIDMFDIELGEQTVQLFAEGPSSLVQLKTEKTEIKINVIR